MKNVNVPNLKETGEFVDALVNTTAQAIVSFSDGADLSDAADFLDEALSWEGAIKGLKDGFPKEAREATTEAIETLFERQRSKLIRAGLNPLLAGAIITNAKGMYYTYVAILQSGQGVVSKA